MKRRVGREDFKSTSPLEKEELSGFFLWEVYEDFDIIEEDGRLPFFRASLDRGRRYTRPLVDTPYLFLEFARLSEHKDHPYKALDTWISKYGLLGLSSQNPESLEPLPDVEDWTPHADWYPEVSLPPLRYAPSGGPGDTFDAYFREVSKANKVLTLYEALLNRDSNKLEQCFAFHERTTPEDLRDKWRSELQENKKHNASSLKEGNNYIVREILDDMLVYKSLPGDWTAFLMDRALLDIWQIVGAALSIFAYPSVTAEGGSGPLSPGKLTSTWRARNLLGAMYLQFYWLITSMSDLSRCKYCGRIISYAPSMPESERRKPRKDKEFCDSRCRQNYHYHNRIKPTRNAT
jgi:hypothetical protein